MTQQELVDGIQALKKQKNAVILAHYYQTGDIQDIADYVGDSLGLSQQAAATDADMIVFAGVHFMGETAKIINPSKTVVIPDLAAGCSLADHCPPGPFSEFKAKYPGHKVITYINCSAEIKALSDVICTSSNAIKIVESFPKDQPLIFAPDKNLGRFVAKETGRDLVLWDGACIVHEAFSLDKLLAVKNKYPQAEIVAHPEAEQNILETANYVGSTTGILNYVKTAPGQEFIVATEAGILHQMRADVPNKKLIAAPAHEDNTCACSECGFMKMNTLQKVYDCMLNETPAIEVPEDIRLKALVPLERMLEISAR